MPKALRIVPTIHKERVMTVNLGTTASKYGAAEIGKAVKLTSTDTYELCAEGDKIEGIITSSEYAATGATIGGKSIGGIISTGYFEVVSDEVLTVGALVVAAAQPAVGTPVQSVGNGDVPCTPVKKAAAGAVAPFLARIESLGDAGTGAAGTVLVARFL